jgi:hypothetical protein
MLVGQTSSVYTGVQLNANDSVSSTSPTDYNFASSAGDKNLFINVPHANFIEFRDNGDEGSGYVRILEGKIGVSVNPSAPLDVSGKFQVAPGIGVVQVNDLHLKSTQITPPVATPTSHAGTMSTCTVSNATDIAGVITLGTTNTGSSAGDVCDVAFNAAYGVAPICTLTPNNAQAAQDGGQLHEIYVTTSTTELSINFGMQPNSVATYQWFYHCVETQ